MQTVSTDFRNQSLADVRKINHSLLISFEKNYDPSIDFWTVGVSSLDGTDVLKGSGSVIQEWDKYTYNDYSSRVLQIEIDKVAEPPTNPVSLAVADITLDNSDDLFTPDNVSGDLYGFLLPKRPLRIGFGFNGEIIQKFVGLTTGRPEIDEKQKTAKFHCMDFLSSIMDIPLQQELIYTNSTESTIIQGILETCGLTTAQFTLDPGAVVIPFAYFKKDTKVGDALREICEAALGNISMSENGTIIYQGRTEWNDNVSVLSLNFDDHIIERKSVDRDKIINVVEVKSNARAVQDSQIIWNSTSAQEVKAGETVEIFANFKDDDGELPVITVDDPEDVSTATTSSFSSNSNIDGSGTDMSGDVSLDSMDVFSTGVKMTFTNSGSVTAYLLNLTLWGTPARVYDRIYVRAQDDASVGVRDGYEEKVYTIENDYIQDEIAANSIAQIVLQDCAEDLDQQELYIKALPQLQISDVVTFESDYFITRINDILNSSGLRQYIRVSKRTINMYWRVGISALDGTDVIGP